MITYTETIENMTQTLSLEEAVLKNGEIIAVHKDDKYIYLNYYGWVFYFNKGVAIIIDNTKDFIKNVKNNKVDFIRLI